MDPDQVDFFQVTLQSYTDEYGGTGSQNVDTIASVFNQVELGSNNTRLVVDYKMLWESNKTDVNGTVPYSFKFLSWMDQPENSLQFVQDLQKGGIAVDQSKSIDELNPRVPTVSPVAPPTIKPTPTPMRPNLTPSPTIPPTGLSQPVIIVIGVAGGVALLSIATGVCVYVWCRNKRRSKIQMHQNRSGLGTAESPSAFYGDAGGVFNSGVNAVNVEEGGVTSIPVPPGVISRDGSMEVYDSKNGSPSNNSLPIAHSESLTSQPSMLSGVKSIDSESELEGDEPDRQTDELDDNMGNDKLEKMRAGVEDNVGGVDEMMSQALIKALTDDDDISRDMGGLMWGGSGDGMEIEASVLCETNDWLKRKEGATLDERRNFMQDILNRMVATVRHNVIGPERGSRAIHGAAAMLGLQLAGELPETAILVSGMRHRVQQRDLYAAFAEFGEIEGCAVAPNSKGFGKFTIIYWPRLCFGENKSSHLRNSKRNRTCEI
jgi:hypothetical protein